MTWYLAVCLRSVSCRLTGSVLFGCLARLIVSFYILGSCHMQVVCMINIH
jgi:hypothetical protein